MAARNVEDREVLIRELVTVMELMLARGQEWVPGSPEPGTPAGYLQERMDWLTEGWPDADARAAQDEAVQFAAAGYVEKQRR
jgi:hypothetical protein